METSWEIMEITKFVDAVIFILSVVALPLSILVLYVGIFKHKVKGIDSYLLVFMSFMDSFMAATWIAFSIHKWSSGYVQLTDDSIWCKTQGSISLMALESTSDCAATLALLRYLVIVWKVKIKRNQAIAFSFSLTLISILLTALSAYYDLARVMPTKSYCEPITIHTSWFARFYAWWLVIRIVIIPVVIVTCYLGIAIYYYQLLNELAKQGIGYYHEGEGMSDSDVSLNHLGQPQKPMKSSISKQLSKPVLIIRGTILKLILVCIAYTICFAPALLTNIIQVATGQVDDSAWVDAVYVICNMSIIIINPLFAMLVHDETKMEIKHLLHSRASSSYLIS